MSRSTASSGALAAVFADVVGSIAVGVSAAVHAWVGDEPFDLGAGVMFTLSLTAALVITVIPAVALGAVIGAVHRPRVVLVVGPLAGAGFGSLTQTTTFAVIGAIGGLVAALVFLRVEPAARGELAQEASVG